MKRYIILAIIIGISCSEVSRDSQIELGKKLFEDASLYDPNDDGINLACVSCHPMGNMNNKTKDQVPALTRQWNTPSLWNVAHTAPYLWRGEHTDLKTLTGALLTSFMKRAPSDNEVTAMVAYISSIPAPISPFLNTDGSMTEIQKRGKLLFEGKGNCSHCHGGKWFTDQKRWRLSSTIGDTIDTPSLLGMWDTAPYWHDGRMATIRDVIDVDTANNTGHKWIREGNFRVDPPFTKSEIDDLEAYLLSL